MSGIEVSRLAPFQLLDGLSQQELAFVAKNCTEMTVPSGAILIQQGQVGKEVYLLEEGSVRVYRGEADAPKVVAEVQAPTVLGEMALLDKERIRTSSVSALSELRLLSIPIDTFLILTGAYPSVKEKLRGLIAARR